MRTAKKKPRWYDPDEFYTARRRAGLTREKAAEMLDITTRTLRNWENGSSRIPYAAFRLMRQYGGYALLGKQWDGWTVSGGKLWTPAGRSFEPHELLYLSSRLWMAREWIAEKAASSNSGTNVCGVTIATDKASAGSPAARVPRPASGAGPCPDAGGGSFTAAGLQGKTIVVSPLCTKANMHVVPPSSGRCSARAAHLPSGGENTPKFGSIDEPVFELDIDHMELEVN